MAERLFTTYQIADLLGATPGAVMEWMQKGWLTYTRLPDGPVRISERGLVQFLKDRGVDMEEILSKVRRQSAETGPATATMDGGNGEQDRGIYEPTEAERRALLSDEPPRQPLELDEQVPEVEPDAPWPADQEPQAEPPEAEEAAGVVAEAPHEPAEATAADAPGERERPEAPGEDGFSVEDPWRPSAGAEEPAPAPASTQPPPDGERPTESAAPAGAEAACRQIVEAILQDAASGRATHIHLSAGPDGTVLKLRIDGVLHGKKRFTESLPAGVGALLQPRLRELAGLPPAPAPHAEAGCFTRQLAGEAYELILHTLPVATGERMVVELRPEGRGAAPLAELGLDEVPTARLRGMLAEPWGLIVAAAPPRAGRERVLRAMAALAAESGRDVLTIEGLVSERVPSAEQVQIDPTCGFTYAQAIRAAVGQDADVLSFGELREPASAATAVAAALAGGLVLAGVNAPSAPSAVAALLEMGAESWPLTQALRAVLAVRQVRRLCEHCRRMAEPNSRLLEMLGLEGVGAKVYAAGGCRHCANTGYNGTVLLHELLEVTGDVARSVRNRAALAELIQVARRADARPLKASAADKLRAGETSLEELARVLR